MPLKYDGILIDRNTPELGKVLERLAFDDDWWQPFAQERLNEGISRAQSKVEIAYWLENHFAELSQETRENLLLRLASVSIPDVATKTLEIILERYAAISESVRESVLQALSKQGIRLTEQEFRRFNVLASELPATFSDGVFKLLETSEPEIPLRNLSNEGPPPPRFPIKLELLGERPPEPREYPPPCPPPPPPSFPRRREYQPCQPPPAALPIPVLRIIPVLVGIVVLVGLSLLLFNWQGGAGLLFAGQMLLLTVAICLTPTVSYHLTKRQGRIARVVVETLLFITLFLAFGYWLVGSIVFGVWIVYATILVLLIETGGHFVEHHKVATLNRLSRSVSFKHVQSSAEALEKLFHSELVLYISVPLGLVSGTTVGLIRSQAPGVILILCLQIVLLLASLVLLFFLVNSFAQMRDPLFKTTQTYSPKIANEWMVEREGFIGKIGRVLRFLVPSPKPETVDQEQKDLDLACMVADLRKVYLYDAVHNVILLVAFAAAVLGLWGISIDVKWLIASLVGLSLLFNQLPFVLGQSALHKKVLERYEGTKRADIAEKLKKYSPLFPTSDFLAALFTTGTAGDVLYVLLDNFIKEALK